MKSLSPSRRRISTLAVLGALLAGLPVDPEREDCRDQDGAPHDHLKIKSTIFSDSARQTIIFRDLTTTTTDYYEDF